MSGKKNGGNGAVVVGRRFEMVKIHLELTAGEAAELREAAEDANGMTVDLYCTNAVLRAVRADQKARQYRAARRAQERAQIVE